MPYAHPLKIGPVQLATNLVLAPMSGYCDVAFRLVARSCGGVGLACTDLLCPEGLLRHGRHSMELAATCPEDSPLSMQLYGSDPQRLAEAARWAEDHGADIVDLNMGCPADKITRRSGGSALLCDPDHALRIVQRIVGALRRTPLTVKLRLGWDERRLVAADLARRLEEAGVAAIAVHGRTTEMGFSGACRLDGIAEVVAAVRAIPIIGNGDIRTPADAARMLRWTGCAGVMIGRAALAAPWLFRDTWSYLATGIVPAAPSLADKCQLMRDHFANLVRFRGERFAIIEFRKRVSWYAKHMHPCRLLRQEMRNIRSAADFHGVIDRFLAWRSQHDRSEPCCAPAVMAPPPASPAR